LQDQLRDTIIMAADS